MSIVVQGLKHSYLKGSELEQLVLDEIDFIIEQGEFVSIIGQTGSGKSTLVQHLNGLVQPTAGKVMVEGFDLSDKAQRQKARHLVGLVMQYPEYQLFEETVALDIAFGPKNMGLSQSEIDERVREAMALTGLDFDRFAKKSPFDLSGGEKRRTALAGVLAMRPKYLILDEPLAGLDPSGRNTFLNSIRAMQERAGCAVVMVSHSMDDVARVSDRVFVMHEGKITMQGAPADVFQRAKELSSIGLDVTQPAKLCMRLQELGAQLPRTFFLEEELLEYLKEVISS